jgi:hypothetical protein
MNMTKKIKIQLLISFITLIGVVFVGFDNTNAIGVKPAGVGIQIGDASVILNASGDNLIYAPTGNSTNGSLMLLQNPVGTDKFRVNWQGNVTAVGSITGASFSGSGSGLTGITQSAITPNIVSSIDGVFNDGGNIDFIEGGNITITPGVNSITFAAAGSATGWADDGTVVRLTTSTDDVGIGTSSPLAPLHVADGSPVLAIFERSSGSPSQDFQLSVSSELNGLDSVVDGIFLESDDSFSFVSNNQGFFFDAENDGTTDLRIANGGNVGIGTTGPTSKLQVVGTVAATTFSGSGSGLTGITAAGITPNIVSSLDGVTNDGGAIDLIAGSGIILTPNDGANTITIAAAEDPRIGDSDDACGEQTVFGKLNCLLGGSYFYVTSAMNWTDAKNYCVSQGARLANINNSTQNTSLHSLLDVGSSAWVGANDISSEGTWLWHNGGALSYTNWASGEPNNSGGEDCGLMYESTAQWNDAGCSSTYKFVCEYN